MGDTVYRISEDNMRVLGRTIEIGGVTWLGYSGSGIEFLTDAEDVSIEAMAVTATGMQSDYAYLGIIMNDGERVTSRLRVARELRSYDILHNPKHRKVKIRVVKLTEERYDKAGLVSVTASGGVVTASRRRARRILFIGDSLTAGYGVLGGSVPMQDYSFTTEDESITRAYQYLAAEHLEADAQFFCWSGNGVISHYIDESTDIPITKDLMPALYPLTAANTEEVVKINLQARRKKSFISDSDETDQEDGPHLLNRWAFSPDLIVSNLGTNDASFVRGVSVRERHFEQHYLAFLKSIARDYPFAKVLVTYGLMEKTLSGACERVALMGDYEYLEFPLMDPELDGIGGGGHPGIVTHEKTADILCYKICQMTGWNTLINGGI